MGGQYVLSRLLVTKMGFGRDRILCDIVEPCVVEVALPVQLQVRHVRIPIADRSPSTSPRVEIDAGEAESRRNQCCGRFSVRPERFSVEIQFRIKLTSPSWRRAARFKKP